MTCGTVGEAAAGHGAEEEEAVSSGERGAAKSTRRSGIAASRTGD